MLNNEKALAILLLLKESPESEKAQNGLDSLISALQILIKNK